MDQDLMQPSRTSQTHRNTRQTSQLSQRLGREVTHSVDARPNMNFSTENERQIDDELVGVDLSFYSGDIFDNIPSVATEALDSSQDFDNVQMQMEAFDLFQSASRQLKRHFDDESSQTPGLQRRNATRRSWHVRNGSAFFQRDKQHADGVSDTNEHEPEQRPVRLSGCEHAKTAFSANEAHSPRRIMNHQASGVDRAGFRGGQPDLDSSTNDTYTVQRALGPCPGEADNTVSPVSSTPSLCAESVSTPSSVISVSYFVDHAQAVPLRNSATAACIDAHTLDSALAMILQRPERTCTATESTWSSKESTLVAPDGQYIDRDDLSIVSTLPATPACDHDPLVGEDVGSQLNSTSRNSEPVYQVGNLTGFIPCLPLEPHEQEGPRLVPSEPMMELPRAFLLVPRATGNITGFLPCLPLDPPATEASDGVITTVASRASLATDPPDPHTYSRFPRSDQSDWPLL